MLQIKETSQIPTHVTSALRVVRLFWAQTTTHMHRQRSTLMAARMKMLVNMFSTFTMLFSLHIKGPKIHSKL